MDNIGNRNNLLSVPIRQQVTASSVSAGNSGSMIQDTESGSGQASGLVGLQPRVGPQDHSDIQQWTTARELANVAAAVAHHDGAQDTPPMSEGDVGEIDGPRMSDIPIQKPAKKTTVGGDVSGILEEQGVVGVLVSVLPPPWFAVKVTDMILEGYGTTAVSIEL